MPHGNQAANVESIDKRYPQRLRFWNIILVETFQGQSCGFQFLGSPFRLTSTYQNGFQGILAVPQFVRFIIQCQDRPIQFLNDWGTSIRMIQCHYNVSMCCQRSCLITVQTACPTQAMRKDKQRKFVVVVVASRKDLGVAFRIQGDEFSIVQEPMHIPNGLRSCSTDALSEEFSCNVLLEIRYGTNFQCWIQDAIHHCCCNKRRTVDDTTITSKSRDKRRNNELGGRLYKIKSTYVC
jgi:hypothetical protein